MALRHDPPQMLIPLPEGEERAFGEGYMVSRSPNSLSVNRMTFQPNVSRCFFNRRCHCATLWRAEVSASVT